MPKLSEAMTVVALILVIWGLILLTDHEVPEGIISTWVALMVAIVADVIDHQD